MKKKILKKFLLLVVLGLLDLIFLKLFLIILKKSKIIILDKLTYAGNKAFLKSIIKSKRVKFIKNDILNTKKYSKYLKNCDLAINVAAESHVDNSFLSPLNFTETNTLGAHAFF